jgi:cytosine/adenosine deaminase-related metal-dependent hydrolase
MKLETWILGGILYTQDEKRSVSQSHIRIVDNQIVSITKTRPKKIANGAKVIDASGLTILPGFIQPHIHLCQTLFRNQADDLELLDWLTKKIWIYEAAHTAETLYTSAMLGIHELLSSGTTCILDMGTVRHTESILKAVQESGIRASVGKCLMDHPTQTPVHLREKTEDALKEAFSLYDRWHGKENDRIRISYAPRFVISCTEDLLKAVGQKAKEQQALIHTHASENQKEVELVRQQHHCENIEYFDRIGLTSSRLVLAHCVWLNDSEKEILKRSGTHVVHCPGSNLKLASGISPVPDLLKRGINVALAADGAPCNNNLNIFNELRLAALIQKPIHGPQSMRAMDVLDMGTRNGAQAMGWFDQIGSIEVGKKADLVALDLTDPWNTVHESNKLNPEAIASSIVYSSQPSHVKWTMVDGKVVFKNGKMVKFSDKRLMERVKKAQKKILSAASR